MKRDLLVIAAAVAIAAEAMVVVPSISVAWRRRRCWRWDTRMSFRSRSTDPNVKAIAGALFKPEGAGPFPSVVFMSGCGGTEPASGYGDA